MIGVERLSHIQTCLEDVLARGVPGDVIEAGAWRGGATILMRAVLKAYGVSDRIVWVADSFEGLPAPDIARYPQDAGDDTQGQLVVTLEEVKTNFESYGLLDQQVIFLKGWFRDTLPGAPIHKLAVMRLDGDMYQSTMDALNALYPKLSLGGYVIVDDYFLVDQTRSAVDDYRQAHGITDAMMRVDAQAGYWQRS
jgi:O-methyltransferase